MIVITLARKPLTESTVAATILARNTGILNLNPCRIGDGPSPTVARREAARKAGKAPITTRLARESEAMGRLERRGSHEAYMAPRAYEQLGRWPANLILQGVTVPPVTHLFKTLSETNP